MNLNGKIVVLTGAGNGMGRELALLLLKRGARVAAVDLNADALAETAALAGDVGARLSLHTVNVADREAVAALPADVAAKHGAIDVLINNAGIIQPFVLVADLPMEAIDRVIEVNLMGTIRMTKAFLPHLLARPQAHICNVSSMGGFLPVPGQTIYGASKAAVKLFTEGLYSELTDTNVGVTLALPGAMRTNIAGNSGAAEGIDIAAEADKSPIPMLAPDRAADIIVGAIERGRRSVFVGKDSAAMDKLYRMAPAFAARLIYKQMRVLLDRLGGS